jgi:hypothetical protein
MFVIQLVHCPRGLDIQGLASKESFHDPKKVAMGQGVRFNLELTRAVWFLYLKRPLVVVQLRSQSSCCIKVLQPHRLSCAHGRLRFAHNSHRGFTIDMCAYFRRILIIRGRRTQSESHGRHSRTVLCLRGSKAIGVVCRVQQPGVRSCDFPHRDQATFWTPFVLLSLPPLQARLLVPHHTRIYTITRPLLQRQCPSQPSNHSSAYTT